MINTGYFPFLSPKSFFSRAFLNEIKSALTPISVRTDFLLFFSGMLQHTNRGRLKSKFSCTFDPRSEDDRMILRRIERFSRQALDRIGNDNLCDHIGRILLISKYIINEYDSRIMNDPY